MDIFSIILTVLSAVSSITSGSILAIASGVVTLLSLLTSLFGA